MCPELPDRRRHQEPGDKWLEMSELGYKNLRNPPKPPWWQAAQRKFLPVQTVAEEPCWHFLCVPHPLGSVLIMLISPGESLPTQVALEQFHLQVASLMILFVSFSFEMGHST